MNKNPQIWDLSDLTLTGALLYSCRANDSGGSIEGTGEAVGAAVIRLVVISRTRVTGNQTGAGEMACRTRHCRRGEQRRRKTRNYRNGNDCATCGSSTFFFSFNWEALVQIFPALSSNFKAQSYEISKEEFMI